MRTLALNTTIAGVEDSMLLWSGVYIDVIWNAKNVRTNLGRKCGTKVVELSKLQGQWYQRQECSLYQEQRVIHARFNGKGLKKS